MLQLVANERYVMLEPTERVLGEQPEATSLAAGGYVNTWRIGSSIVGQLYDANGAAVGLQFTIGAGGWNVSLDALPSGGFVAAWEDSLQGVVVRVFDSTGKVATTAVISDASALYGRYQQATVAVLSSGEFVVAFTAGAGDNNNSGIRAQLFNADGTKTGAEFNVNTVTLGGQFYPRAVSLSDGKFFISWVDDWNGSYGGQIFNADGSRVGGQINIAPGASGIFDIAVLTTGNMIVVWPDSAGELRGQLYSSGGLSVGAEFQINVSSTGTEILPDVAALPSGGFAVTWRAPTQDIGYLQAGDIRAQLFDSDGRKVGEEVLVSTGSLGQSEPQIAAFGSGDLVITYVEFSAGGQAGLRTSLLYSSQVGSAGPDSMTGSEQRDFIFGLAGDDILSGGIDADVMIGGSGNDSYEVDNINDVVFESPGEGVDKVFAYVNFKLPDNVENLIMIYGNQVYGYGNASDNFIVGNAQANVIEGRDGNDRLEGGAGHDVLLGGTGADSMAGGTGNDEYEVDNVNDTVFERAGEGTADKVYAYVDYTLPTNVENLIMTYGIQRFGTGNEGDNIIFGNAQGNVIRGGAGYDTLTGGAGSDLFVVNPNFGVDVITDFVAGAGTEDAILFSTALFTSFSQIIANAAQIGADTWIGDGHGNTVVLTGVLIGNLHPDDFGFV